LAEVARPSDVSEAVKVLEATCTTGQRVIARGLGRAYGDAAQCAGGTVIDLTGCKQIIEADEAHGVLRAEAGLSVADVLDWCLPRGFFPPVTPGTRHVTLGGALAADVHGKNHHVDGTFSRYVRSAQVATPKGVLRIGPGEESELFWATAGGMGLTGVVLEVTLELLRVESPLVAVDTERASDLDDCMSKMTVRDEAYRYSVAWIDCLASGGRLGRGVITRANHVEASPRALKRRRQLLRVPFTPPVRAIPPAAVAAFNGVYFRRAPLRREGELQDPFSYFYPLDALGAWNRLYGPRGFTQYQFVVPFGSEAVLKEVIEGLAAAGLPVFLAVLKRFGAASPGPLSFPRPGWTLALDLPLGLPGLSRQLDLVDEAVAEAGGSVYLAKDGRLEPSLLRVMYPRLEQFLGAKRRFDPDGLMSSDLSRRLGLSPEWPRDGASRPSVARRPAKGDR
jgi:decaprenylphospho-beta-D-ribofuranose 2-oxidase